MRVIVDRAALLAALKLVSPAVEAVNAVRRTAKSNVRIRADEGGRVEVAASDGEVFITHALGGADVDTPGEVLLAPGKLTQILRESTGKEVSLKVVEDEAVLKTGGATYRLPHYDPAEFPDMPPAQGDDLPVYAAELARAVRAVGWAADRDKTGNRANGLTLDLGADGLWATASSAAWVAAADCLAPVEQVPRSERRRASITPRAASILAGLLPGDDLHPASLRLGRDHLSLTCDGTAVSVALYDTRPAERRTWGEESADTRVGREALLSALRSATVACEKKAPKVELWFGHRTLFVKASSSDGKAEVMIEADGEGGGIVPVHPEPLLKALAAIETESVRLLAVDRLGPVWVEAAGYSFAMEALAAGEAEDTPAVPEAA